jgi:quercetin 2,3-dioxygenase
MSESIFNVQPLGFPWPTVDPFLFCAYHDDSYPAGNGAFGPKVTLAGRNIGQDFSRKDGWSMYHGQAVPGFPAHPHRGFETVTIVRKGLIDHADSLGAKARFGDGDVQWLTAGKGIVHSEMFPLLSQDQSNPLELFQIWLNLPAKNKMVDPYFTMLWRDQIARSEVNDENGYTTTLVVVAGNLGTMKSTGQTPPSSWAAEKDADVLICTVKMAPFARWTLPVANTPQACRCLYFFNGQSVLVAGQTISEHAVLELNASSEIELINGPVESEFLLLQGRPIAEPVAQHGPFVMNTQQEIRQAVQDFQRTQFGGWPWPNAAPVHGGEKKRFAHNPGQAT